MTDLNAIARRLAEAKLNLTDIETRSPREVRISVERDSIPTVANYVWGQWRGRPELIVAEDARPRRDGFMLRYLYELDGVDAFIVASAVIPSTDRTFPSLATRWYLASRYEREIHDLFGLEPAAHPDLRRLPLHQFWPDGYHPLLKDADPDNRFIDNGAPFPFRVVAGEGLYEITVGPVHAGIIEPGHFRFSVEGETIVNLESRLYFVHKGIEKLFESKPVAEGVLLAERISGDSSVGHALAYCQAIETLADVRVPPRAGRLRVVLLELERLYNHVADVGAICTDTGFTVANAHAMRLREDIVRLNARLSGHRLLRGMLAPGGLTRDISAEQLVDVQTTIARVLADFMELVEIALSNGLVVDRLQNTGHLSNQTAREMQVVGLVARASGIDADARRDHPFAAYADLPIHVSVRTEGDVWARLMVRVEESREAVKLITLALDRLPEGRVLDPLPSLRPGASAFGLVEGWRGPIWHWVVAGESNSLARVKIKDPSFANWPALNYAILQNIVPDFPLVNKSFNLSYAGNDL
jgi:Ni,Fe-hydrogenase III large subunit/Ni,Fe-hydrogenase III component G